MITGAQIREARELLELELSTLAQKARVRLAALIRAEGTGGAAAVSADEAERLEKALEAAGIIFVEENGEGPKVTLKKDRTS